MLLTPLSSAFELAQNMALLVLGAFAYSLLRQPLSRASARTQLAVDSILFSALVIVTMLRPLVLVLDIHVDSRVAIVACSILFSGPVVGLVVAAVAALFRLWIGGVAAWAGVIAVLCAFLATAAFRHWLNARRIELRYRHLVVLGVVLGLCKLAGFVALPTWAIARDAIAETALPVLIIIPLATALLGTVILRTDQGRQLARRIADGAAQFRTVIDNLPVGVGIRDRSGRYTLVNKTFRERVGMPEHEIIGFTNLELAVRLNLDPGKFDTDREILAGKPLVRFEPYKIDVNGRREWIVAWHFPIRNAAGEIEAIGGTQAIVTDLVEARNALQSREDTLHRHQQALLDIVRDDAIKQRRYEGALKVITEKATMALDVARTSIYDIDIERDTQRCLALWDREIGAHREGPAAKWSDVKQLFSAYDTDRVIAIDDIRNDPRLAHRSAFYESIGVKSMLTAAIYVEGRVRGRLMFVTTEPRVWSVEDIAFARSIAHVITLIFIDKERQELQQRLEQASKMEAIGRLAGGVAHDFNNLLGSINGFAGFLVQDLPAGSELRVFAERIVSACQRGNGLIAQILALARARNVERKVFDLRAVLLESGEFLGGSLPKSTRISFEYTGEVLPVYGGDTQLSQIVMNLCVNANDALNGLPGSITVRLMRAAKDAVAADADVPASPGRVAVGRLDPARDYARLEVIDTGTGMSPEVLRRIAEPFFTTKERSRGTGLGLAVVHDIVTSHGGAYRVESAPGEGTRFTVYIPLATPEEISAEAGSRVAQTTARGSERILVIDDQEEVADMLVIGLGRLGYDAIAVTDPIEALQSVEEDAGAWDAIVTDDAMPAMRGLTLVSRVKNACPRLKVILCTGFNEDATDAAARAAGADAFFVKPVTPEQIASKLRQLIEAEAA